MAAKKYASVVDPSTLRIDHADYEEMDTDAEKRRAIKKLLDKYNFAIPPETLDPEQLKGIIGGDSIPSMEAVAKMGGVAIVRCHYDETENTGKIEEGKPVCFNMVKGNCVTGVNEVWNSDEYKVLGTALQNYQSAADEGGEIPIRLSPPGEGKSGIFLGRTRRKEGESYPEYSEEPEPPETSLSFPFYITSVAGEENPEEAPEGFWGDKDVINLHPSWIKEHSQLVVFQFADKYYTHYREKEILHGVLAGDLLPGGSAPVHRYDGDLSPMGPNLLEEGQEAHALGLIKPGYRIASGSQVIISCFSGRRYYVIKSFTCQVPQV